MIYMEPLALGWEPLLKSWIETTPDILGEFLKKFLYESLFMRFCNPLFYLLRKRGLKVLMLQMTELIISNLYSIKIYHLYIFIIGIMSNARCESS